jgi:hypothetical protein
MPKEKRNGKLGYFYDNLFAHGKRRTDILHSRRECNKIKVPLAQCSPISERALLFGKSSGFARLSWKEQHVDENEYGAEVE